MSEIAPRVLLVTITVLVAWGLIASGAGAHIIKFVAGSVMAVVTGFAAIVLAILAIAFLRIRTA